MSIDKRETWLASLKAGDIVGRNGGFSGIPVPAKVDRVTATQVIIGATRYAKKDGYAIGSYSRFSRPYIVKITDAIRAQIERRDLIAWASNHNWNSCSTEQLRAMKKACIDAAEDPAKTTP